MSMLHLQGSQPMTISVLHESALVPLVATETPPARQHAFSSVMDPDEHIAQLYEGSDASLPLTPSRSYRRVLEANPPCVGV
jgi:hypothetical protein